MAVMLSDTSNLGPNLLTTYLEKRFVSVLKSEYLATPLGKVSTIPEYGGNIVRWQFFAEPAAETTTIGTEGGDPAALDFTTTTAQATLDEYGGFTDFSRHLISTGISGTLEEFVDLNAMQAARTLDALCLASIDNTTTTSDAGTAMTAEDVRAAAGSLALNNARFHRSTGGKYYCGIFKSESCYDMMGEGAPTWFQAKSSDYMASLQTPFDGTPNGAAIYNVLIKMSNNVQRNTATADDDELNVIIADDSFGVAAIDSNILKPRVIVTQPDDLVSAPARNHGTAAWWVLFATVLFDNARVAMISSDATGINAT